MYIIAAVPCWRHFERNPAFTLFAFPIFPIEAIHCEWRSSVVLDVRHVGFSNTYFNIGIGREINFNVKLFIFGQSNTGFFVKSL